MLRGFWNWVWRHSIRRQLVAGVALVYLALMSVFVGCLVIEQRGFLRAKARDHALAGAELLAASCLHGVMANDLAALQEIIQSMRSDRALRYSMIMDLHGRILAHTDSSKVGLFLQDQASSKLLQSDACASVLTEDEHKIDVAVPIIIKDRPLGWARLARSLSDDNRHILTVTYTGVGFTLVAILIGTCLAAAVGGAVLRPLKLLLRAAQRIAHNQWDERIPVTSANEVGTVSAAFNSAMDQLQQKIAEREQAEARLREQARHVMAGAQALTAAAAEILGSARQLAQSATDAATAVTETTATTQEVRQTAQAANEKAAHVAASAKKAEGSSQIGGKFTEATITGMQRIQQQMDTIAAGMVHLNEQTQAIGQIIASVDDLAAQSKVLAVNAAIEAAKAEEHGKGFSVVAAEVKSLAEQSKRATQQVRKILNDIQKATEAAARATKQGSEAVEAGVRQSIQVGATIQSLAGNVAEAAQSAAQITVSSQQQLIGMDQVASAMERIRNVTVQNVANARQLQAAATNLNDLGKRLEGVVETYSSR